MNIRITASSVASPTQNFSESAGTSIISESCTHTPAARLRRPQARSPRRSAAGFTLIELMIAVAVAGVLSGVAYPSFIDQVLKVRRSDALVAMMQVQWAQERWRANQASYGSLSEIGVPSVSAARHYTLQMGTTTQDGYDVIAMATGPQARDAQCRYMKLTMAGHNTSYASGPDTATDNPGTANRQCWML